MYGDPGATGPTTRGRSIITVCGKGVRSFGRSAKGGGYYPRSRRELAGYLRRNKVRALKILKINAQIMKISMPDYLGQMKLDMEGGHDEAA